MSRQNSDDLSAVLLAGDDLALKLEQWPGSRQVGFSAVGQGDAYFNCVAPENAWVHLVFVATPTQTQLFVNGVLQDTLPGSIPLPRRQIGSAREGLRGLLDEVQIFDRALAPDEVPALFLNFSAPTP